MTHEIIDIFYLTDEFCREFTKRFDANLIGNKPKKALKRSDSKVITKDRYETIFYKTPEFFY